MWLLLLQLFWVCLGSFMNAYAVHCLSHCCCRPLLLQGAGDLVRCVAAAERLVMMVGDEQPAER